MIFRHSAKKRSGATLRRAPAARSAGLARTRGGVKAFFLQHLQALIYSLGQLSRTPGSTLMTAAVIGIALALPAGLHVLLKNVEALGADWRGVTQISVFLKPEQSDADAARLAERVRALPGVETVTVRTRAEALDEFRRLSGFGAALEALGENPLPAVLVVQPGGALQSTPRETAQLLERLRALPEVELAQADMQWLQRLTALLAVAQRGVLVTGAFLALAVLLIVGNTIRLAIHSRRDEIEIIKLVGATDAFVRRPFLYNGLWYGLFGGIIACVLVGLSLWLLTEPVRRLSALYAGGFELGGLDGASALTVLASGVVLGLGGSLLAVKRHLAAIEPV